MSRTTEKIELIESEGDRVFRWRYETLLRAGLDDVQATVVAAGEFDLHVALKMLRDGCTPELLATIAN